MIILGIETSCDETSVGIVENGTSLLALSTLTSLKLHSQTGGIIPEVAAREQVKSIIPALKLALQDYAVSSSLQLNKVWDSIDAIAVTQGPGLIGSLLVGVETARTLSYIYNKPLIPTNHLLGHVYSAWLHDKKSSSEISTANFPLISLIVSGGHTDVLYFKAPTEFEWIGGTLDDAAGECMDKVGRQLGILYPAGPTIDKWAEDVQYTDKYKLPRPLITADNFDFSFSGLKTAAAVMFERNASIQRDKKNFASSLQEAIMDTLVTKTIRAAETYHCENIVVGGGVSANKRLRTRLHEAFRGSVFFPLPYLAGDNGAMIAAAAHTFRQQVRWQHVTADPSLYFG